MLPYIFIILGVISRLLPHPPNFTPIAALALFGGVYLTKKQAILLPLFIMIISDILIGLHDLIAWTWGSFLLVSFLGIWLKNHKNFLSIVGTTFLSSLLFFVVTNFGVWISASWYPHTLNGLLGCYVAAIPFYRNSLLGDLTYVSLFFGAYESARVLIKKFSLLYLRK